ncbi:MAG: radical SAM protein, partial [Lentisphaerae bacterium]|nr:radical SAM protein [Lentisphaerota bacterium]
SPTIFQAAPHYGDEPPISRVNGAGIIFFSRCTLSYVYYQNFTWSMGGQGTEKDLTQLQTIMVNLDEQGCHNWNFVTPTPWVPMILAVIEKLNEIGVSLPIVYNTSGYERTDTLAMMDDIPVVYLTDLRYASSQAAGKYSDAGDYVTFARPALLKMVGQQGHLLCDDRGIAKSGVICRLLVLPDNASEAVENLKWIADEIGTELYLSIMSQFTPAHRASEFPEINRCLRKKEYDSVVEKADELGFNKGWIQEFGQAESQQLAGYNMTSGF